MVSKQAIMERIMDINMEISEYEEMLSASIANGDKNSIKLWRKGIQTAKNQKRRLLSRL